VNLTSRIDESQIASLVAETKAAGTWNVPTEILLENWYGPDAPDTMRQRPEMRYAEVADVRQWVAQKRDNMASYNATDRQRFIAVRRRLIKALHDGGAGLLLGSDAPQVWNVPGFSIHRELASYVAAGLTPYQALATGTRNVAAYLRALPPQSPALPVAGIVREGAPADLVLLTRNPLENITNTSAIAGVLVAGKWLSRPDIDRRLAAMQ
jgi:hypothetical protein